jgi:hypothetical protein
MDEKLVILLKDEMTPATILNAICLKEFSAQYYNWEPETLKNELVDLPEINYDKIQAISTIVSTQGFYDYYETFNSVCAVLNNYKPFFSSISPCSILHVCWGIYEAHLNDEDYEEYSPEVLAYIESTMKKDGICRFPTLKDKNGSSLITIKYDIYSTLDDTAKKLQDEFEEDAREYLKKRLSTIKELASTLK